MKAEWIEVRDKDELRKVHSGFKSRLLKTTTCLLCLLPAQMLSLAGIRVSVFYLSVPHPVVGNNAKLHDKLKI